MALPFLNPWLLTGLAAVGLPVLIHLLNRHRAVTIEWGAMELLRRVMTFRSRQVRLEDILLMLLRCLVILLAVLAWARPTTKWFGAVKKADVGAVIALDGSMSMGHRPGLQSRLDLAVDRVREIFHGLAPGTPTTLVVLGNRPHVLLRNAGFDPVRFEQALRDIKPGAETLNLERCLPDLRALLAEIKAPARELYLVTDAQAVTWAQPSDAARHLLTDVAGPGRTFLLTVGGENSDNIALTKLELAAGDLRIGSVVRYQAQVRNCGSHSQDAGEVSLQVEGTTVDTRLVGQLAAGQAVSVPLYASFTHEGVQRLTASLGDDALAADNARYAVAHVRRSVRVLCVDGEPSDLPSGGASAYAVAALDPNRAVRSDSGMEADVIPWMGLATARLREYDVVFLINLPDLPEQVTAALRSFVEQGGGLVVFLGRSVNPTTMNQRLAQGDAPLLPAALGEAAGQETNLMEGLPLDFADLEHPLLQPLRGVPADLLKEIRIYRYYKVRPYPQGRAVLRTAGGDPVILEKALGRGKVILFTSSADRSWSNLVVNPAYPILLHQAVSYLVREPYEQALTIPEPLVLPLPGVSSGDAVTVTDPGGDKNVALAELRDGEVRVDLPETTQPGFYTVATGPDRPPTPVAVNVPARASDVRTVPADTLADTLRETKVQVLGPGVTVASAVAQSRTGRELWWVLALGAVAALACEAFLARWFTHRNDG